MTIDDLNTGDVIHLARPDDYMKYVLKYGGKFRRDWKGTVMGFTCDWGHCCMTKVHLEDENGEVFCLYDGDLQYWEKE